jgi:phytoene desaturase
MRILVIGSGFGGLAAAIRLQAQGHTVTVLEAQDQPGGRAAVFRQDGFTFDAGPTIITAPWLIHELFALGGGQTSDYVELKALDPFYNIRFEDGSIFRYNSDRASLRQQVRDFREGDLPGYDAFVKASADIFKTGFALIDKPFSTFGSMMKVAPDLVRLRADRSVAKLAAHHMQDDRLRQIFSFHPLLVGGNPFQTTSIYALIHHLEQQWGVWFVMGGTGALVHGFVRHFENLGGTIRYNARVDAIEIDDRTHRATGVRLADGTTIAADAVVSNADVVHTYKQLVPSRYRRAYADARLKRLRHSMSLFVIYFGTDRQYHDIAHHEILMGPRYKGLLDDIFGAKTLSDDFSLYLHRPTATDPSLAPPGCDSWYVLSPVPNLEGDTDWAKEGQRYRDRIFAYLEERYLPDVTKHIVSERRVDPRYFRDTMLSHAGNAFGVEPILTQSAWFRPHNVSEDIPNLYLTGAGTHPGAGLPGVMSSGKIVADMIGQARGVAAGDVRVRLAETVA